jgi:hypothetical protein
MKFLAYNPSESRHILGYTFHRAIVDECPDHMTDVLDGLLPGETRSYEPDNRDNPLFRAPVDVPN